MKKRSVQAMSISLSALALAGPISLTAYAKSVDESSDVEVTSIQQEATSSNDEENIAEDISNLSEQLNNNQASDDLKESGDEPALEGEFDQQIDDISNDESAAKEAVEAGGEYIDNAGKASQAINDATEASKDSIDEAGKSTDAVVDTSTAAANKAEAAVENVSTAATKEDAVAIIAEADKSIQDAKLDLDSAITKYESALSQYNLAKEDYDIAVAAYNSNKEKAQSAMTEAEAALEAAQIKLDNLENQVKACRQQLAAAGADAIISAESNKASDTKAYVATVLEYYYIPNSQNLDEGQKLSNLVIDTSGQDNRVAVTYDVTDAQGNVLRTVTADYGYTVDTESGEIQLFTSDLTYEYTNAAGEVVSISQEQAKELNGQIEIENYWSVDGYYVPRYRDYMRYTGEHSGIIFSSDASEIASGIEYVNGLYYGNPAYYKADVVYNDDWTVSRSIWEYKTKTTGTFTATYNKVSERSGYALPESIKNTKYASEQDALAGVIKQAKTHSKAYTIDQEDSRIEISHQVKYAQILERYVNIGDALWSNSASSYTSYIDSLKTRLAAYDRMLQTVANAKDEFQSAQLKVEAIQNQIANMTNANNYASAAELVKLEIQLDNAKADCSKAQDNLQSASDSLAKAQELLDIRFAPKESTQATNASNQSANNAVIPYAQYEIPQEEASVEPEEIELIEEDTLNIALNADTSNQNGGAAGVQEGDNGTSDEAEVTDDTSAEEVTIPEEEVPLAITLTGLLQRGKWFAGLAGVSAAGAGVAYFEAKRRAAAKIIDKLNQ